MKPETLKCIHPTAVVDPSAELAPEVTIGAYAVVGPKVRIGARCQIGAHSVLHGPMEMGCDNKISPFTYLGGPPQHVEYKGEDTSLIIGDRNVIREYVTMHRGTVKGRGTTRVGSDNFIMAMCHIAHDCLVGNKIIMANSAQLAGHITVEDNVVFGGITGVHQYCRVGRGAMVAGMSRVPMDVPPFSVVGGSPARFVGLNRVGLRRIGITREIRHAINQAYKIIFRSGRLLEDGLAQAEAELGSVPEVKSILSFIRESKRGVIR